MGIAARMRAVQTTGHGGLEKLEYREDVETPTPASGEVLIRVGACGMNNTDINTRTAWYSKSVTEATDAGGAGGFGQAKSGDSTWGGASISFPRIQGADVAGTVVAVGDGVPDERVGERVLVDPWMRDADDPGNRNMAGYFGSERDGGYAEYTTAPAGNAFPIDSLYSDAELATFPCSYSTGEYMLTRARLAEGESVLITGASGGVGSALVQLAKRRGAHVIAVAGRGGRYVTSGAIAGPVVELDLRTLYLKDLELQGATVMPVGIFESLVGYIEREEIRPLLAGTFPLARIREAQSAFLEKKHVGNFVITLGEG
jgi:NADPH:quinone reductase-like Zn-dependent oxidoreductase